MKTRTGTSPLRAVLLSTAILLPSALLYAGNGGSVYSRYGVGDLRPTASTLLMGMGGTGAAVRPSGGINDLNPAAWSDIRKVRFTAAALYEGYRINDGTSSLYLAGVTFNGLSLAIPVDSALGVAFGAGLLPVSRVRYTVIEPEEQAGLAYTLTQTGEGGISKAFLGLTVEPLPGMSVGAQFNFYFGSNRYLMTQDFTGNYAGTDYTRIERFRGPGATIGLLYEGLGGLVGLAGDRTLAAGASVSTAARPNVATERVYAYGAAVANSPNDTLEGGESTVTIPLAVTAGLSYAAGSFLAAADVRYQDWTGTTFGTSPDARLTKSLRISGGVEFTRANAPNTPPGRRTAYSFGAYHDGGYLDFGGERISENGVTAGFTFPILNETRLSLAGSFGMRGSTNGILEEEKIFRISASMDITEFWFQRPAEE